MKRSWNSTVFRLPRWLEILLAIVVLLEIIAPFIATTHGTDGPTHMYWTARFREMLEHGTLIPRWIPNGFYGYGAPTFYFYPPLYFYYASALQFATGISNEYRLMQMAGLTLTIASAFTCWKLLRTIGAPMYQGILGSLLYAFGTFRIAELYSRTSMPSHLGYVILPLLWCGLYEIVDRPRENKGIVLTGVSAALLFLSTIPLTVGTAAIIFLLAIVERRRFSKRVYWKVFLATSICIGISAYLITSILQYRDDVQFTVIQRIPDYLIIDLFKRTMLPAVYHFLLLYGSAFILLSAYWPKQAREKLTQFERITLALGVCVVLFFLVLDTPYLSVPLWRAVSLLAQGSWRYYIYFLLFAAVAVAVAQTPALRKRTIFITGLSTIGALLPLGLILGNIHFFQHDPGRTGDTPEYLPKAVPLKFLHTISLKPESDILPQEFAENVNGVNRMTFHRFYWPAWHLFSNGNEVRTWPDSVGRVCAEVQPGSHLEWRLEQTPLEKAGEWVSVITIGSVLSAGGIAMARKGVRNRAAS